MKRRLRADRSCRVATNVLAPLTGLASGGLSIALNALGNAYKGPSVASLVSMISLVGCAGPVELHFKNSIVVDHLDGKYQRLASCTYEHLARQQAQLSMTDLRK